MEVGRQPATKALVPLFYSWQRVAEGFLTPFLKQLCFAPFPEASVLPKTWHFLSRADKGSKTGCHGPLSIHCQARALILNATWEAIVLVPFYSWRNQGSERLGNFPKSTHLGSELSSSVFLSHRAFPRGVPALGPLGICQEGLEWPGL